MSVKIKNTTSAPISENNIGINDGIIAARTQCTELPKACPEALIWFGKISEMKTQITAPWPMACEAINKKRKIGTVKPPQL
ncbi:hypothetical protein D3C80_1940170 [compost metagenome]